MQDGKPNVIVDETEYWLLLCELSETYPECVNLKTKISDIIKILSKIISSSKTKSI